MPDIKTVGIKELKNNLSAYLRDVRRGTRVLVADRTTVVAELHEPSVSYAGPSALDPVLEGWVRSGIVQLPLREKVALSPSPVSLRDGTAQRLLNLGRDEESA